MFSLMRSSRRILVASATLVVAALPARAHAQVTTFTAFLNGANERPTPTPSAATGFGTVTLDPTTNMLTVVENWSGLTAPATGAHIHCCAGPEGSAAVAIDFVPNGFPVGTVGGTYTHTFNLLDAGTYGSGFLSSFGTVLAARNAVVTGMLAGQTYLNIHDTVYPAGEIRGQLIATPEPATFALLAGGLGAVGLVARRRRSA